MDAVLEQHIRNRLGELQTIKAAGGKVVGYLPGSYVPEEIIYASGAVPVCLCEAGDVEPVESSSSTIPRNFCSFVRAQVGDKLLGRNPLYGLVDMVVAPVACQHLKKMAEIWEYDGDLPLVKLGVPLANTGAPDLEYYANQLRKLKVQLERLTGGSVDDQKLRAAIGAYNGLRDGFRRVASLRRNQNPPISSLEFLQLQHASLYADPLVMTGALQSRYAELANHSGQTPTPGPRLLLIGPNVCKGDYKIIELVQAAGGSIVAEFVDEGVRNYWQDIDTGSDPLEALARGYLRDRVPCAFMIESARTRLEFALDLIAEYSVAAAVWYELRGCETYDSESHWFARQLEQRNIPVLVLESDFGPSDLGNLRTRVDAFIEMVKGV
jgi:benzoyl-CoA reductase/2-hydroxyglutaryl-CoA dehydratase subunit BcrC/BadD/HgdB